MEVLASFPTVRLVPSPPSRAGGAIVSCAASPSTPSGAETVRRAVRLPRLWLGLSSGSIMILIVVAATLWAAVWWNEQWSGGGPASLRAAETAAAAGETVKR